jgi:predicted nuclease of predicted toxin-antitoxin system
MKIKLDENLPASLADELISLGHDVDTVPKEGLGGRDDPEILAAARNADRFLITQDLDFSDVRSYEPGSHPGILLIRLQEPARRALTSRVRTLFTTEDVEAWKGCLVVATVSKVRIRQA